MARLTSVPEAAGSRRAEGRLPARALLYLAAVGVPAAVLAGFALSGLRTDSRHWGAFAALASAAALAQLFVVRTPGNQSYHTTIVVLIAAVMVLPPAFLPLVAVVQHLPEWLKERYRWPLPVFNVFNYTIALLGAAAISRLALHGHAAGTTARWALAASAAAVTFVAINHLLVAGMIQTANGLSFRSSGVFSLESLGTDLVLAALGVPLAALWLWYPWLTPAIAAPLFLLHRSLSVPVLREQAQVDPRTGLFNARYFDAALRDELERTRRFGRPLSVLMVDIDLLRDLNNLHGHLAGDAAVRSISDVFRQQLRSYDVAARSGGDEFAIVLPEAGARAASEIAERIRAACAETVFSAGPSRRGLRATISIGTATYPADADEATRLVERGERAVDEAKLGGGNRVASAGESASCTTDARFDRKISVRALSG